MLSYVKNILFLTLFPFFTSLRGSISHGIPLIGFGGNTSGLRLDKLEFDGMLGRDLGLTRTWTQKTFPGGSKTLGAQRKLVRPTLGPRKENHLWGPRGPKRKTILFPFPLVGNQPSFLGKIPRGPFTRLGTHRAFWATQGISPFGNSFRWLVTSGSLLNIWVGQFDYSLNLNLGPQFSQKSFPKELAIGFNFSPYWLLDLGHLLISLDNLIGLLASQEFERVTQKFIGSLNFLSSKNWRSADISV